MAAIVPLGDETWFFKLAGPVKGVEQERAVARAGHHAKILIADGNYPASTKKGPQAEVVCLNLSPGVVTVAQALRAVSETQNESTSLQREFQLGNPEVSLEQTMLAMQKSQLGFQAAVSVRNRLVQAYTEIMNMQV